MTTSRTNISPEKQALYDAVEKTEFTEGEQQHLNELAGLAIIILNDTAPPMPLRQSPRQDAQVMNAKRTTAEVLGNLISDGEDDLRNDQPMEAMAKFIIAKLIAEENALETLEVCPTDMVAIKDGLEEATDLMQAWTGGRYG